METHLAEFIRDSVEGREAEAILRKCVHCGFCTATCPTYQLLGDELDGPRGRIYLIKQVLEGATPTAITQRHLDRCLSCRNCESTCPSGVDYGRLVDIGRHVVERRVARSRFDAARRRMLRMVIPHRKRFGALLGLGRFFRPVLPGALRQSIPPRSVDSTTWPAADGHRRQMLALTGCAQSSIAPGINAAAARVLDRFGIRLISVDDGCCGAVSYHLSAHDEALDFMRRNVDAWWPYIEAGAEAIVVTASGCGVMVKDYGHLLRHDPDYAMKSAKVSELARDLVEVVEGEDLEQLGPGNGAGRIAFQSPCTLQHGQQLGGRVEGVLRRLGFDLTGVPDGHLCCGSAGTYSILNAGIANQLRANKLEALASGGPDVIATANIGCLTHLQTDSGIPVVHWITLLDRA